jgi:hypothetical protein
MEHKGHAKQKIIRKPRENPKRGYELEIGRTQDILLVVIFCCWTCQKKKKVILCKSLSWR